MNKDAVPTLSNQSYFVTAFQFLFLSFSLFLVILKCLDNNSRSVELTPSLMLFSFFTTQHKTRNTFFITFSTRKRILFDFIRIEINKLFFSTLKSVFMCIILFDANEIWRESTKSELFRLHSKQWLLIWEFENFFRRTWQSLFSNEEWRICPWRGVIALKLTKYPKS